jgi:hypothetical protein
VQEKAANAWPDMPDGVEDRAADVWEPLLAVADLAGGEWPDLARVTAVTLVTDLAERPPTLGVRLLSDLRDVFRSYGDVATATTDQLLRDLHGMEEAPWSDLRGKPLDARGLANRLRPYDVKRTTVRVGEIVAKGYRREDLADAWSRYLPPSPPKSVTSVTSVTEELS